MSYVVSQRAHELGIRAALGAQPHDILKLMLRRGMKPTFAGVCGGLLAAGALTRLMERLLFGVSATDWLTFASVVGFVTLAAFVACYLPARRAARVDPLVALRRD